MSAGMKAMVALCIIIAFGVILFLGIAVHQPAAGSFLGAMVAGVIFDFAQRIDRRYRTHRGMQ